jgi:TonB family protein
MPLNVRRFCAFLIVSLSALAAGANAQAVAQTNPSASPAPPVQGPTSGDIMRDRILKAKAFIAVRNYNAAIYELENIRRESADDAVRSVAHVLLMNSYLEQGDFKRGQDLLTEFFNLQKSTRPGALASYMAVAGQVIKGARSRADRYKALGLNIADRTLPLEALNDLEKMRELLEAVVTQSKEIAQTHAKANDAMALMEEATASRSMLARDDYDSRRWKDVVADTREQMASSRSVVLNAVNDGSGDIAKTNTKVPEDNQTAGTKPIDTNPVDTKLTNSAVNAPAPQPGTQPVSQPVVPTSQPVASPPSDNNFGVSRQREVAANPQTQPQNTPANLTEKPVYIPTVASAIPEQPKPEPKPESKTEVKQPITETAASAPQNTAPKDDSPMDVGSLVTYATHQSPPVYPLAAKSMRASGVVKVEVTVDEKGDVATVKKVSGPMLLQDAAKDAIKKWKFKPFVRDGQPVKATGFINFSFTI